MTRYIEWDYERGIATEYERHGECNGCGDCCRSEVAFDFQKLAADEPNGAGRERGGGASTDGQGVWQEVDDGNQRTFRRLRGIWFCDQPCSQLGPGDHCVIHQSKPKFCALWPVSPRDTISFPMCGYSFCKLREWEIDRESSQAG